MPCFVLSVLLTLSQQLVCVPSMMDVCQKYCILPPCGIAMTCLPSKQPRLLNVCHGDFFS